MVVQHPPDGGRHPTNNPVGAAERHNSVPPDMVPFSLPEGQLGDREGHPARGT